MGLEIGFREGATVGEKKGDFVGEMVGWPDGDCVGLFVDEDIGRDEGFFDGSSVGALLKKLLSMITVSTFAKRAKSTSADKDRSFAATDPPTASSPPLFSIFFNTLSLSCLSEGTELKNIPPGPYK